MSYLLAVVMVVIICGAQWFFTAMEELCQKHDVDFILSVSADPDTLPDFMKGYII